MDQTFAKALVKHLLLAATKTKIKVRLPYGGSADVTAVAFPFLGFKDIVTNAIVLAEKEAQCAQPQRHEQSDLVPLSLEAQSALERLQISKKEIRAFRVKRGLSVEEEIYEFLHGGLR